MLAYVFRSIVRDASRLDGSYLNWLVYMEKWRKPAHPHLHPGNSNKVFASCLTHSQANTVISLEKKYPAFITYLEEERGPNWNVRSTVLWKGDVAKSNMHVLFFSCDLPDSWITIFFWLIILVMVLVQRCRGKYRYMKAEVVFARKQIRLNKRQQTRFTEELF